MKIRQKHISPARSRDDVTGETIQKALEKLGLSQWNLAHRVGVEHSAVSQWITGESRIPEMVKHLFACDSCYGHWIVNVALRGPEL